MASLSLAECCRLLTIDPKTLRQWLAQTQMALHTDPTNAKIKCLEVEQVETLARLHGRMLQLPTAASAATTTTSEAQSQVFPPTVPGADLRARLAHMEISRSNCFASGSSAPNSVCWLWKPNASRPAITRQCRSQVVCRPCRVSQPCLRCCAIQRRDAAV